MARVEEREREKAVVCFIMCNQETLDWVECCEQSTGRANEKREREREGERAKENLGLQ